MPYRPSPTPHSGLPSINNAGFSVTTTENFPETPAEPAPGRAAPTPNALARPSLISPKLRAFNGSCRLDRSDIFHIRIPAASAGYRRCRAS